MKTTQIKRWFLASAVAALLAACGGGSDVSVASATPNMFEQMLSPKAVKLAAQQGANGQAIMLYQALYGKAPSNPMLTSYVSQIGTSDGAAWADALAANFSALSNSDFATLVLNNISITPSSLNATAAFGSSQQAYEALQRAMSDYLNWVGIGRRGTVALQVATIIAGMENETQFGVYGNAAIAFNSQSAANLAYAADVTHTTANSVAVPILVQATSYLNAKNLNIPAQKLPQFPNGVDPVKGAYGEYVATAVAYGDFFQTGQMSMVVVTSRPGIGNTWQLPGVVHFYKFDSAGNPVDNTSSVLPDATGCLATRKLLVADFNGDGKPDVYLSCHGSEYNYPNWTGEKTRVLLSQPNGTYTNTETSLNCYCHGSAAADLNGDGKVDIITSDGLVSIASRSNNDSKPSSMVTMINDGTGHFTVVRDSNYQVVPAQTFTMTLANGSKFTTNETMYDMELVDVNGDGKVDLIAASANDYTNAIPHSILLNNGNGTFSNYASFVTGIPNFWGLDIIVKNDNVYLYGVSIDNSISTAYAGFQYMAVVKFNLSSKAVSTIWNSNGHLWKNEVPTQPHDFNWMMPYNGNLVPLNAAYGVSIPMQ
jgi:hypothetical protein